MSNLVIRFEYDKGYFVEKEFENWEDAKKAIESATKLISWKRVTWMKDDYYTMFEHIGE
jgi:hypothetical protein